MPRSMSTLVAVAIAALLAASGCGGSPRPRHFTLSTAPGAGEAQVASLPAVAVYVGPVDFPRYLDRPEIVVREGANGLKLSETNRWGGSLRNDFTRVLADDLGHRLGTERVVTYPNDARYPIDYRVQVELLSFEGTPGESVGLRARWVVSGATGAALATSQSDLTEPTASVSYDDLVAAHGRALDRLATEIATRIAALASRTTAK